MDEKVAWLVETQRFSRLLGQVYCHHAGDIWLVNNDLYVFRDQHLFKELYLQTLSMQPYITSLKKVHLVLDDKHYTIFETEIADPTKQIAKNLSALTDGFLHRFHVSKLPEGLGASLGAAPWTFYTVGGSLNTLTAGGGIVIVRPPFYPFTRTPSDESQSSPSEQHVAVAWQLGVRIDEAVLLRERIQTLFDGPLREIHSKTLQKQGNRSLKLINDQADVNGNHEDKAEKEDSVAWADFPPTADIGVVCALEEETGVVRDWLDGRTHRQIGNRTYDVGFYKGKNTNRTYAMVLRTCERMGSVYSAIASLQLIQDWRPRWLFLVGICAGDKTAKEEGRTLQLGDVIVPYEIIGYEYQKLQKKTGNPYNVNVLKCSAFLQGAAGRLHHVDWAQKGSSGGGGDRGKNGPFLWAGEVAVLCGNKLMDDKEFFETLKDSVRTHHRKIVGIEMEGEGAAAAAKASEVAVEFLFIKGVSDYAHMKGNKSDQAAARTNAAKFLFVLLDELARGEAPMG